MLSIVDKVFRKLSYQLPKPLLEEIVQAKSGSIEIFLSKLQQKIAAYHAKPKNTKKSISLATAATPTIRQPSPTKDTKDWTMTLNDSQDSPRQKYEAKQIHQQVDKDILMDKEMMIQEQRETIQVGVSGDGLEHSFDTMMRIRSWNKRFKSWNS